MPTSKISPDANNDLSRANQLLRDQQSILGRAVYSTIGLTLLDGLLILLQAGLLAYLLQQVVHHQALSDWHHTFLFALLPIFACRLFTRVAAKQVIFKRTLKIKHALRARILLHIGQLGPIRAKHVGSGQLVHCLTDAVEAVEAYYSRYLPAKSLITLLPLLILIAIIPVDWWAAIVMLVTAPLIPLFMVFIGKTTQAKNQRQWRRLAQMGGYFLDRLQGMLTLKLFSQSQPEALRVKQIADAYRQDTMAVLRVAFLSSLVLEFLATVAIAMIAVLIGFRLMWGEMTLFQGLFVLLLAPEFYLPLRQMGGHYHARMDALAAAEQLSGLFEQTPLPNPGCDRHSNLSQPPLIEFKQVSLSYVDEQQQTRHALKEVNLTLTAGESLGLVGPSGCGKSSIANLLCGFIVPDSGNIYINGGLLTDWQRDKWQQQLAWVSQQPTLFQGSIAENIALAEPNTALANITLAAKQANLHDDIMQLPQQYQTQIGERGQGLSVGQCRRLALARAFCRNASLIILDEPTASLDHHNRQLIMSAIEKLACHKTVLIIAHHLETLNFVDRIAIMQDGEIKVTRSGKAKEALCTISGA